jgi:hypothetical protein
MTCSLAKSQFSAYLDGALTGRQMRSLGEHLEQCAACKREYLLTRQSQQLLMSVGRAPVPPDLALRLRVAISREAARSRASVFEGFKIRLENALNAFMVPATAGLAAAIAVFGLLMGFIGPLQAVPKADVPLLLYTTPELQSSAFGTAMGPVNADSLVIEAVVDSNGRVQDYRVLSEPDDAKTAQELLPQVKNMLIFTTFRPATSLGRPTAGRTVLSFSKVSVKG